MKTKQARAAKHVQTQTAKAAQAVVPPAQDSLDYAVAQFKSALGKSEDISWTRCIASGVVNLMAAAGGAWLVLEATEILMLTALVLNPSGWLAFVIFVLGIFIAYIAGYVVSRMVGSYVRAKRIDKHAKFVWSKITGVFHRNDELVAA